MLAKSTLSDQKIVQGLPDGEALKALRKQRGLTQEDLARALQLETRTIQRWEAGKVKPSIKNFLHVVEQLNKIDWQQHPIHKMVLNQDGAVALMDRFAFYRHINPRFRKLYQSWSPMKVEDEYAGNLFGFWKQAFEQITDIPPESLAASNITSIDHCLIEKIGQSSVSIQHQVLVVRQKNFSTFVVHEISEVSIENFKNSPPKIERRTKPPT